MSRRACYASDIENPELGTPNRLFFDAGSAQGQKRLEGATMSQRTLNS